jgi:ribosomal protein S17E
MKNEKSTETINESIENSMKWFQESAAAMTQTYDKQIEFAKNLYGKAFESTLEANKGKVGDTHGITEMLTKNMENFMKFTRTSLESAMHLGQQNNSPVFSKQNSEALISNYTEQMESVRALTEKQFDYFKKEFNALKSVLNPIIEKSKEDLEANFESSKETLKTISDLYFTRMHDSMEANKELLAELNTHMSKMMERNNKIWTDLLHQTETDTEKTHPEKASPSNRTAVHETGKKTHTSKDSKH